MATGLTEIADLFDVGTQVVYSVFCIRSVRWRLVALFDCRPSFLVMGLLRRSSRVVVGDSGIRNPSRPLSDIQLDDSRSAQHSGQQMDCPIASSRATPRLVRTNSSALAPQRSLPSSAPGPGSPPGQCTTFASPTRNKLCVAVATRRGFNPRIRTRRSPPWSIRFNTDHSLRPRHDIRRSHDSSRRQ
jgi:hypothetical protein